MLRSPCNHPQSLTVLTSNPLENSAPLLHKIASSSDGPLRLCRSNENSDNEGFQEDNQKKQQQPSEHTMQFVHTLKEFYFNDPEINAERILHPHGTTHDADVVVDKTDDGDARQQFQQQQQ